MLLGMFPRSSLAHYRQDEVLKNDALCFVFIHPKAGLLLDVFVKIFR